MVAVDQLGNAIAGGNEDSTISARLGYLYTHRPSVWTTFLKSVVDVTFYSVDGDDHCVQAYHADPDERYIKGNKYALGALGVIVIASCLILIIPVWVYSLFT